MRILLAEDDEQLVQRLQPILTQAGYVVSVAGDGIVAEELGQVETFQAAVVDLGLPGMDGLSVIERWRTAGLSLPVLVLTARGRWHDKLAGFDAGADDFLTKPFHPEELILRLRALIRRSTGHASPQLRCGPLQLDINAASFSVEGQPLSLSPQEFRLLSYFIHHQDNLISRERLGEHVFESGFDPDSNALDVLLGRVRRKLPDELITTVRGQGWRLSTPP
jgi:two-component system OmpR family response regulator